MIREDLCHWILFICNMGREILGAIHVIAICPLMLSWTVNAQVALKADMQYVIENSCKRGLMLMSSEYALSDDSGQTFAFDGAEYVGKQTSMAVLVDGGYVTTSSVLYPWKYDDASKDYDAAVYSPVITEVEVLRPYSSEGWEDMTKTYDGERSQASADTSWHFVSNRAEGFRMDGGASSGKTEGWIVLLTSTSKEDSLAMTSYRHTVDLQQGRDLYDIPKNMTKAKVYGGIYVKPTYDEVGCIRLSLVGLILPEDSGWKMMRLSIASGAGRQLSPVGDVGKGAPSLTPIGGGQRSDDGTDETPRKRKSKK